MNNGPVRRSQRCRIGNVNERREDSLRCVLDVLHKCHEGEALTNGDCVYDIAVCVDGFQSILSDVNAINVHCYGGCIKAAISVRDDVAESVYSRVAVA